MTRLSQSKGIKRKQKQCDNKDIMHRTIKVKKRKGKLKKDVDQVKPDESSSSIPKNGNTILQNTEDLKKQERRRNNTKAFAGTSDHVNVLKNEQDSENVTHVNPNVFNEVQQIEIYENQYDSIDDSREGQQADKRDGLLNKTSRKGSNFKKGRRKKVKLKELDLEKMEHHYYKCPIAKCFCFYPSRYFLIKHIEIYPHSVYCYPISIVFKCPIFNCTYFVTKNDQQLLLNHYEECHSEKKFEKSQILEMIQHFNDYQKELESLPSTEHHDQEDMRLDLCKPERVHLWKPIQLKKARERQKNFKQMLFEAYRNERYFITHELFIQLLVGILSSRFSFGFILTRSYDGKEKNEFQDVEWIHHFLKAKSNDSKKKWAIPLSCQIPGCQKSFSSIIAYEYHCLHYEHDLEYIFCTSPLMKELFNEKVIHLEICEENERFIYCVTDLIHLIYGGNHYERRLPILFSWSMSKKRDSSFSFPYFIKIYTTDQNLNWKSAVMSVKKQAKKSKMLIQNLASKSILHNECLDALNNDFLIVHFLDASLGILVYQKLARFQESLLRASSIPLSEHIIQSNPTRDEKSCSLQVVVAGLKDRQTFHIPDINNGLLLDDKNMVSYIHGASVYTVDWHPYIKDLQNNQLCLLLIVGGASKDDLIPLVYHPEVTIPSFAFIWSITIEYQRETYVFKASHLLHRLHFNSNKSLIVSLKWYPFLFKEQASLLGMLTTEGIFYYYSLPNEALFTNEPYSIHVKELGKFTLVNDKISCFEWRRSMNESCQCLVGTYNEQNHPMLKIHAHECIISSLAWSGSLFLSSSYDGQVKCWDLNDLSASQKINKTHAPQLLVKWIGRTGDESVKNELDLSHFLAMMNDSGMLKLANYTQSFRTYSLPDSYPRMTFDVMKDKYSQQALFALTNWNGIVQLCTFKDPRDAANGQSKVICQWRFSKETNTFYFYTKFNYEICEHCPPRMIGIQWHPSHLGIFVSFSMTGLLHFHSCV